MKKVGIALIIIGLLGGIGALTDLEIGTFVTGLVMAGVGYFMYKKEANLTPEQQEERELRKKEKLKAKQMRPKYMRRMQKMHAQQYEANRVMDMDRNRVAYCPKCHSTSLTIKNKGFGIFKAAAGAAITHNPAGLAAGHIGSNRIKVVCLNCGHQFRPGRK